MAGALASAPLPQPSPPMGERGLLIEQLLAMAWLQYAYSAPEIDLDHARVSADMIDRPFGKRRSLVQHRHPHVERPDKRHVVLDHDNAARPVDIAQQLGGLL